MELNQTEDIVALAAKADTSAKRYRLTVVNAGISHPSSTYRLASEIADKTVRYLREQGKDVELEVVNLRDFARDIADASLTFKTGGKLAEAIATVVRSDGLIVASPIYKASYSGLFKEFWDVVGQDEIRNMPVLLAATGGSDRHALVPDVVMRGLFAFFRAVPTPTSIMATKDDFDTEALICREERAARELGALIVSGVRFQPAAHDPEGEATGW